MVNHFQFNYDWYMCQKISFFWYTDLKRTFSINFACISACLFWEEIAVISEIDRLCCSLPHGRLFEYICTKMQFDEYQAANFICLLLDAVQYLHNCRIAHLDIKVVLLLLYLLIGSCTDGHIA